MARERQLIAPAGYNRGAIAAGLTPALVVYLALVLAPLGYGVWLSVTDWDGIGAPRFTGAGNYLEIFRDPRLYRSLRITVVFAAVSASAITVIATLLASAVTARVGGSRIYGIVWFLPSIAPATAVAVFWATAFQPGTGAVNVILGALGLPSDTAWLGHSSTALIPPLVGYVWISTGFAYLLALGAMRSVPTEIHEAATLDGAHGVRHFVSITLPLIRGVLFTTFVLQLIWAANGFTLVFAMTGGGPARSTEILPVLVYNEAFQSGRYGPAAAMAVVNGALLLLVSVAVLRSGARGQRD